MHGAIYIERGLRTAEGKDIKNKEEILALLAALWEPKKLAIVHCPGHQKSMNLVSRGNNLDDQMAKKIARASTWSLVMQLPDPGPWDLPPAPEYSEEDLQWIRTLPMTQILDGWWRDSKCNIVLPERLGRRVLERIHRCTHLGTRRMQDLVRQTGLRIRKVSDMIDQIVES